MPIRPSFPERLLLYRLNRGPAPIVDLFAGAGFRAVALAIDMGVFEALDAGHGSPTAVADAVDADTDGINHLLDLLAPLGYVERRSQGYAPSAMTRSWLLGDDPNLAPWFTYWQEVVFPYWDEHLEASIRAGEPPVTAYEYADEHDLWEVTQRGFRAVATLLADDVFDAISLPGGEAQLLDVGGGHGYYTIEACTRQPELRATILDSPGALELARDEIATAGLADRIDCRGGDALESELGSDLDLVFCFNVVHGFDPETNRELFGRIGDALAPGGRLVLLDQFASESRLTIPRIGLAFTGFVYNTALGATVYEAASLREWLHDAGFTGLESTKFRSVPGTGLIEARRPE